MVKQSQTETKTLPDIPDPASLFLKAGLYAPYNPEPSKILAVERFSGTIDLHCVECDTVSVFVRKGQQGIGTPRPNINATPSPDPESLRRNALRARTFDVEFECSRNAKHKAVFFFKVGEESFLKVGQYPSRADIEFPELAKYRGVLGSKYVELIRSVGLDANGIGIGSFVYLRRIFEDLIETAHTQAAKDPNWDEALFINQKWMDKKIQMLKDRLPPTLVENRSIYGILSKGIHELTEEECLEYFEPLKIVIELILDEQIERQTRERKIAQSKQAISSIAGKVK